jgi:acetylglutamate kinase
LSDKTKKPVTVIKLGGSLLDDQSLREQALQKIVSRWNEGEAIVLVHGGGKHIDRALAAAGIEKRTHAGLRVTDAATLGVVVSVLGGAVNKMLVSALVRLGVHAAGVSGCDGGTLTAEQHPPIDGVELGHVGRVVSSDPTLVWALLDCGFLPVVSSIAAGDDGSLYNVNADSAASAIAVAHSAGSLVFLTDVAGLLDADGGVVAALDAAGIEGMLASPVVQGGMRPKLEAALTALRSGVTRITIAPPAIDDTNGGTTLVAA